MADDIVIIVEDGLVTYVYALDPRMNVKVIDLDPGAFDQEGEDERLAEAEKVHADKRYTEVY